MESKEKLSNIEFKGLLAAFIQRRLKEGLTREQTKKEFENQYIRMKIKQFELIMFYDFLIEFRPKMLKRALDDNDEEAKSYVTFMRMAWMFRADFHHRSFMSDLNEINKNLH